MKKIIAIIVALALVICFAGCGGINPGGAGTGENYEGLSKTDAEIAEKAYKSFIAGTKMINTGTDMTFDAFCKSIASDVELVSMPVDSYDTAYAIIDCGNDGMPDLALKLTFHSATYGDLERLVVITYKNDKLAQVADFESYYRYSAEINSYGYVASGGSSGAASYGYEYYYINGDGECVYLYKEDVEMSLPKAMVAAYQIADPLYTAADEALS